MNNDGNVNISDVSILIDYLLSGDASAINMQGADVDGDNALSISDVSRLIDMLLAGN